jgi:hypothetical protein
VIGSRSQGQAWRREGMAEMAVSSEGERERDKTGTEWGSTKVESTA